MHLNLSHGGQVMSQQTFRLQSQVTHNLKQDIDAYMSARNLSRALLGGAIISGGP